MPRAPVRIRLCGVGDVASGASLKVETHGLTVAVFNLDGEFYVTDDHCTHGPGSLSEGFIGGDLGSDVFRDALCHSVDIGEERPEVLVEVFQDIAEAV